MEEGNYKKEKKNRRVEERKALGLENQQIFWS